MNRTAMIFITTTMSFLLIACAQPDQILVSGSTTVQPAVAKSAEAYNFESDQIVIVSAGGSGTGFRELAVGKTQIGMMSRNITPEELAEYSQINFKTIAIGRDGVAPVISSEIFNAGVTSLSLEEVAAIYRGEIDNWSYFGGPYKPIFVIDKKRASGTRQTFMRAVMGDSSALAPGADLIIDSNNEEQRAISQSDAAIGMLSHAWLNDDVKGLSIRLKSGSIVEPNLDNIRAGKFPITRDLNIIIRGDVSLAAQDFVDYLIGERGQSFVSETGYISISE